MLARFLIGTEADDRTILWIHDSLGNRGKSKLVKWLISNAGAVTVPNDYKNTVRSCPKLFFAQCGSLFCPQAFKWNGELIVLLDVPRHQSFLNFDGVESLKNGLYCRGLTCVVAV